MRRAIRSVVVGSLSGGLVLWQLSAPTRAECAPSRFASPAWSLAGPVSLHGEVTPSPASGSSAGEPLASTGADAHQGAGAAGGIARHVSVVLRYLSKLSGPGPFLGGGLGLSFFEPSEDVITDSALDLFSVHVAGLWSQSTKNDLVYTDSVTTTAPSASSRRVHVLTLHPSVEARITHLKLRIGASGTIDHFYGDLFDSFNTASWGPMVAIEAADGVVVGGTLNFYPRGFAAADFGAKSGLENTGTESVWDAYVRVNLAVFMGGD
jgi:hypothetical protein